MAKGKKESNKEIRRPQAEKPKAGPGAETQRRRAIARWENEGGAGACGPQVAGSDESLIRQNRP